MREITNTGAGPKIFHLRDGTTRTLAPGEAGALDLAVPIEEDRVVAAWLAAGEIHEGVIVPPPPDEAAILAAEAEAIAALAKARVMRAEAQRAALGLPAHG